MSVRRGPARVGIRPLRNAGFVAWGCLCGVRKFDTFIRAKPGLDQIAVANQESSTGGMPLASFSAHRFGLVEQGWPLPLTAMPSSRFPGVIPFICLEFIVRNLASALILLAISVPALAVGEFEVPEPSSIALMVAAVAAAVMVRRRAK